MTSSRRSLACALIACAFALTSCGKSEPPAPGEDRRRAPAAPAAPAAAPAPRRLRRPPPSRPTRMPASSARRPKRGSSRFRWCSPTSRARCSRRAPRANTFRHRRTIPDATTTDVAIAERGLPVLAGVARPVEGSRRPDGARHQGSLLPPGTPRRYTNVVSSIGKRTTGHGEARSRRSGPGYKGAIPEGTSEVRCPTNLAWIFGRTAVDDKARRRQRRQDPGSVQARGPRGQRRAKPPGARPRGRTHERRGQVAARPGRATNACDILSRASRCSCRTIRPPRTTPAHRREDQASSASTPGKPFDASKLEPAIARRSTAGVQAAIEAVSTAAGGLAGADIRNGGASTARLARWGNDYGRRRWPHGTASGSMRPRTRSS